ncbi:MAG: hypothetical protein ACJKSS_00725 [Patescibacteria group bacterium UBA2103]
MNMFRTLTALSLLFIAGTAFAQGVVTVEPLTDLPGIEEAATGGVGVLINTLYTYLIGIGAISAVLIIMWGGFKYMTSEAMGDKSAGREDIQRAVLGLLLLLSPVIVFGIINRDITSLNIDLGVLRYERAERTNTGGGGNGGENTGGGNSCTPFPAGRTVIGTVYDSSITPDPAIAAGRQCCTLQTNCEVQAQRRGGNNSGRTEYSCSCEEVVEPITGYFWKGKIDVEFVQIGFGPRTDTNIGPLTVGPYDSAAACQSNATLPATLNETFANSDVIRRIPIDTTEPYQVYVNGTGIDLNCEYAEFEQ